MSQYRSDCFWWESWCSTEGLMYQCYLAETGECPCTSNCEWFISKLRVRAAVFEKQMKEKEK